MGGSLAVNLEAIRNVVIGNRGKLELVRVFLLWGNINGKKESTCGRLVVLG